MLDTVTIWFHDDRIAGLGFVQSKNRWHVLLNKETESTDAHNTPATNN